MNFAIIKIQGKLFGRQIRKGLKQIEGIEI